MQYEETLQVQRKVDDMNSVITLYMSWWFHPFHTCHLFTASMRNKHHTPLDHHTLKSKDLISEENRSDKTAPFAGRHCVKTGMDLRRDMQQYTNLFTHHGTTIMIMYLTHQWDDEQGGLRVSAVNMVRIQLYLEHLLGNQEGC